MQENRFPKQARVDHLDKFCRKEHQNGSFLGAKMLHFPRELSSAFLLSRFTSDPSR